MKYFDSSYTNKTRKRRKEKPASNKLKQCKNSFSTNLIFIPAVYDTKEKNSSKRLKKNQRNYHTKATRNRTLNTKIVVSKKDETATHSCISCAIVNHFKVLVMWIMSSKRCVSHSVQWLSSNPTFLSIFVCNLNEQTRGNIEAINFIHFVFGGQQYVNHCSRPSLTPRIIKMNRKFKRFISFSRSEWKKIIITAYFTILTWRCFSFSRFWRMKKLFTFLKRGIINYQSIERMRLKILKRWFKSTTNGRRNKRFCVPQTFDLKLYK